MPIREFSTDCHIEIRDSGGTTLSSFSLPIGSGKIMPKPRRPDGPPTRTLLDGRRKERRTEGFYLDVELEWEELSPGPHQTLVNVIDALHLRAGSSTVHFCPESPPPTGAEADGYLWRVVPSLEEGMIDVIYENRVRERGAALTLKAHDYEPALPGWLD